MWKRLSIIVVSAILVVSRVVDAAEDPAISDAILNDVHFVDARQGWAVGDRGTIWHTTDGGQTWQLQSSGTVCSLKSVWFSGDKTGWIVGGQGLPYSPASSGLILATWDGGLSWQPLSWQQFPRLHRVQFLNPKTGWAWGEASESYPSGLFSSDNAGRLWNPAGGAGSSGWLAGFFSTPEMGVLAGPGGASAVVADRLVRPVSIGSLGSRAIRCVKLSNDGTAWGVGDGGLILRSNTLGASWMAITPEISDQMSAIFDWRGVHTIAGSVWAVGRPGSVVMQSADAGKTWNVFPTGQTVPLEAVWFHDRQRGWAVGALGTILATQDGGRTWQVQRRGGERAALLTVHGGAISAPLLTHAQLGGEQGYLAADLAMVGAPLEWDDFARPSPESRLSDAVSIAGGMRSETDWRFPVNPVALSFNQVLDDWNRQHEGKALQELERRLAVAIRVWRPEVVVAESPDPADSPDPAAALISQALERAFQSAADPTAFPELIDVGRLGPWSAKTIFAVTRDSSSASVRIDAAELCRRPPWAGKPLDDQATLATSLLAESFRASDAEINYRRMTSRIPPGKAGNSLMDGIVLEPGGPARRKLASPVEISDADRRAVQTRRNLLAIVNRAEGQPILARQLTGQLDAWLKELGPDQGGTMLYGLARMHFRQGRWSETREALEKLLLDYPTHLTATEAHRWLVQYYASSEARHRERVGGVIGQMSLQPMTSHPEDGTSPAGPKADSNAGAGRTTAPRGIASDQQVAAVGGRGTDVPWAKGSLEAARRMVQVSQLAWSDPGVQFPLAAAHRTLGNSKDADRFYTTFALGRDFGPWSDAARGERWIRERKGMPSKPVIVSLPTTTPPHLDGVLDDPLWKSGTPMTLQPLKRTDGEGWQTLVRLAHDQHFFYIAISCDISSGDLLEPLRPRARDMDLSAQDRVDLYLDLDRDYATYYHLAVDRRGCVWDDCWGDRTWDPTWFVASKSDERGYRIEAAIPWGELTDTPVQDGTVWGFNAVRIVPGRVIMSWSRPAGVSPRPEGLGYLLFSDGLLPPPRAAVAN